MEITGSGQIDSYWQQVEKQAWQSYEQARTLYHVTAVKNLLGIIEHGIQS